MPVYLLAVDCCVPNPSAVAACKMPESSSDTTLRCMKMLATSYMCRKNAGTIYKRVFTVLQSCRRTFLIRS